MPNNCIMRAAVAAAFSGVGNPPTRAQVIALANFDGNPGANAGSYVPQKGSLTCSSCTFSAQDGSYGRSSLAAPSVGYCTLSLTNEQIIIADDFTLETRVYLAGVAGNGLAGIFGGGSGAGGLNVYLKTDGTMVVASRTFDFITTVAGTFRFNQWNHIALTRSGARIILWVNGKNVGQSDVGWNITANPIYLAYAQQQNGNGFYLLGYIDEFRYCKGIAIYTEEFTPSTVPFTLPNA